jgi:hypothetical protein
MRRVVAISDSRSGNRSASGLGCLDDLFGLVAAFLADFFVDLLDFFDLLEDLERADAFAMNDVE